MVAASASGGYQPPPHNTWLTWVTKGPGGSPATGSKSPPLPSTRWKSSWTAGSVRQLCLLEAEEKGVDPPVVRALDRHGDRADETEFEGLVRVELDPFGLESRRGAELARPLDQRVTGRGVVAELGLDSRLDQQVAQLADRGEQPAPLLLERDAALLSEPPSCGQRPACPTRRDSARGKPGSRTRATTRVARVRARCFILFLGQLRARAGPMDVSKNLLEKQLVRVHRAGGKDSGDQRRSPIDGRFTGRRSPRHR